MFAAFEAQARECDLSPTQCRAGREISSLELEDLADVAGLDASEIEDFEDRDEHDNLTICERFQMAKVLWAVGVTFYRSRTSEGVRIKCDRLGGCTGGHGPSGAQNRAGRALAGWALCDLADLSGLACARIEAFEGGAALSDDEGDRLAEVFRAAGVRFYRTKSEEGVRVKCRRPWPRPWLDRREGR